MRFLSKLALAAGALSAIVSAAYTPNVHWEKRAVKVAPKVLIISMFEPEADVWYGISQFNVLAQNITVPGLSPLYPQVHCTSSGDICQVTIGEAEINASNSMTALIHNSMFDFTKTYFMVAGIAGINPEVATICSVTFAKYAVQVALQYEFSQLEIPSNFSSGYIPLGAHLPNEYPTSIYGTEVFEVNQELRSMAVAMAKKAILADNPAAKAYRANYGNSTLYTAGAAAPSVVECDVATSDVYYSGVQLSDRFANTTRLFTNGSGVYCTTAQEDNGTAEALLRAAISKLVDFSRLIIMRTASDFDRPYPGEAATTNLFWADQGAFEPSLKNIYRAGVLVVEGIVGQWNSTFEAGIKPSNYVGDIFGTLGGKPDFGPYAYEGQYPIAKRSAPVQLTKRSQWVKMARH